MRGLAVTASCFYKNKCKKFSRSPVMNCHPVQDVPPPCVIGSRSPQDKQSEHRWTSGWAVFFTVLVSPVMGSEVSTGDSRTVMWHGPVALHPSRCDLQENSKTLSAVVVQWWLSLWVLNDTVMASGRISWHPFVSVVLAGLLDWH